MDAEVERLLYETKLKDNKTRRDALNALLSITEKEIGWFNEALEDLQSRLKSENSFQRSIGMLLLCELSKSDDGGNLKVILPDILQLMDDKKFITRRQTIQNIWKIAVEKENLRKKIIQALLKKFHECLSEEHFNLIRQDIIYALFSIHQKDSESCPIGLINDLIESEKDDKIRKNYRKILEKGS